MGKRKTRPPPPRVTGRYNGISPNTKGYLPFVRLYADLLQDKDYLSLKDSTKSLYTFMLLEAGDDDIFTFTVSRAVNTYGMTENTFYGCRNELEKKGFIEVVERNPHRKMPNVYRFTSRWKNRNIEQR